MSKLLFFSNNKNKIIEIKKIFNKFNLELLSLNDLNLIEEPEESVQTFEENAKIKSDYGFNKTLAELSTKDKNEISHRSIAVNKLINFLSS